MIRILYVLNGQFSNGGIESFVTNYFFKINSNDIKIDFMVHGEEAVGRNNPIVEKIKANDSKIYYVTNRSENYFKNKKEVTEIFKSNKFDIVHTHMDAAGYFILKIAKQQNIKVRVSHSHNTAHLLSRDSTKNRLKYKILEYARINIRKVATHHMACSKLAGEWLYGEELVKKNKVSIINNSIETSKFTYDENIRKKVREELKITDEIILGHVGRFEEQKNHEFLLEIIKVIHNYSPNKKFKLLLVGEGSLFQEMEKKANDLKINDSIIFYGNSNRINELYQAMDIFLLPSLFEGLPFVGIEAQASGLKCLISKNVSEDVKVTNNIKLLSIDVGVAEWVEEIIRISDGYKRKNMYSEISSAHYDVTHNATVLTDIYKKIMND